MIKLRRMRRAGHVASMEEKRELGVYRILVGRPEGRKPLGRSLCIILKTDLQEMRWRRGSGLDLCGLG